MGRDEGVLPALLPRLPIVRLFSAGLVPKSLLELVVRTRCSLESTTQLGEKGTNEKINQVSIRIFFLDPYPT